MAEQAPGWGALYNGGVGVQGGDGGTSAEFSTWTDFTNAIFADDLSADLNPKTYIYTGPDVTLGETEIVKIEGLHRKTLLFSAGQKVSRGEIRFVDCSDFIIRNWTRRGPYYPWGDGPGQAELDYFTFNSCTGYWVHYCDCDAEGAYNTTTGEYPDGMIDTNLSNYISISHCKFWNGQRVLLIGYSDTQTDNDGLLKTTIAYCWFRNNASRQPKGRFGDIHLINCILDWDPEWDLADPKPSSSEFIGVDAKSQIILHGCWVTGGQVLRDDEDTSVTPVVSGLKFIDNSITNFVSTSLDEIRPENVLWDPFQAGYVYIEPVMSPADAKIYVENNSGAVWHLQSSTTSYPLTTGVNDPLGGSIIEVSTGQYNGEYAEGDLAEVDMTVNAGYQFDGFVSAQVADNVTAPYSFLFPAEGVTVTAMFSAVDDPEPAPGSSFRFVYANSFYGPEIWGAYQNTKSLGGDFGTSLKEIKNIADKLLAFSWDMLNVPFANKDNSLISLVGANLDVQGGGGGSLFDKNGLLVTGLPNDRPRFNYNPETGLFEGVYVEIEDINKLTRNDDFSNAYWTKARVTVDELHMGPDGNPESARKLLQDTGDTAAGTLGRLDSISGPHVWSIFAKKAEKEWCYFRTNTSGGARLTWFDINSGIVGSPFNWHIPSIEKINNGFFRIKVQDLISATSDRQLLYLADSDGSETVSGDGGGVLIYGFQLSLHDTSYIATSGSPVTRPADIYTALGLIDTANPYSIFEIRNGQKVLKYVEPAEGTVKTYVDGEFINTDSFTPIADFIVDSQGSDKVLAMAYKSGILTEQERIDRTV